MKVSAILPVYNSREFLLEALRSILQQTIPLYEIIIVDDGSTDGSSDVIREFVKEFSGNTKFVVIETINKGAYSARNLAVDSASGDAVMFCDSDDIQLPRRLEYQIPLMERGFEVVGGSLIARGLGREEIWNYFEAQEQINVDLAFSSGLALPVVSGLKAAFKRIPFNQDIRIAGDHEAWQRHASLGTRLTSLNRVCAVYRMHPNQISSSKRQKQIEAAVKFTGKYLHHLTKTSWAIDDVRRIVNLRFDSAAQALRLLLPIFLLDSSSVVGEKYAKLVLLRGFSNNIDRLNFARNSEISRYLSRSQAVLFTAAGIAYKWMPEKCYQFIRSSVRRNWSAKIE